MRLLEMEIRLYFESDMRSGVYRIYSMKILCEHISGLLYLSLSSVGVHLTSPELTLLRLSPPEITVRIVLYSSTLN